MSTYSSVLGPNQTELTSDSDASRYKNSNCRANNDKNVLREKAPFTPPALPLHVTWRLDVLTHNEYSYKMGIFQYNSTWSR